MAVDLDELAARARDGMKPKWDDVREQRVLSAISRPRRQRAPKLAWIATSGLAVAVVILAVLLGWPKHPRSGWLELEDGSTCALELGARLRVVSESSELVRLEQARGRVVYRVSHRRERAFEVVADPIVVRVRGTRFAVEVTDELVRVSVTEGRVEVQNGSGLTELGAGDALRVSRTGRGAARERPAVAGNEPPDV